MVHPGGLLALRLALRAVAKATLSSLVPAVNSATSSIPSLLKISENMVHPGGFEPPTARFVAEYSIQLSYGCIGKIYFTADIDTATKAISSKRWCIREDYSLWGAPFGVFKKKFFPPGWGLVIPPSFIFFFLKKKKKNGASGRIRTSDRSVRSRVLYPAELRMHRETYFTADFLIPLLKPYQVRDGASGRITRLAARPSGRC